MDVWKQFEENNITHSAAHHLLAIMELREKRGYARVTDVAKHLNITTGSASTNLKSLKGKRLIIEDDNRFLTLSPEGEALARAVIMRKNVFEKFLVEVLQVTPEQAEIDACKTEHLISVETARKLQGFLEGYLTQSVSSPTVVSPTVVNGPAMVNGKA
jgi:DtxR family transcriptional regulator, Mn-dependent transcriptional regulator